LAKEWDCAPLVTTLVPSSSYEKQDRAGPPCKLQCDAVTGNQISELLSPFLEGSALSDDKVTALLTYLELLLRWNAKINLTAIREADGIVTRHFGESLFAACHLLPEASNNESAIDIGSGAGLPGIPLKIWAPGLTAKLVEANQKKATFLREVIRTLHLKNVEVLAQRAESVSETADLVTFRAVEYFGRVLQTAKGLVSRGGRIGILIGEGQVQTTELTMPDFQWEEPLPIPQSRNRVLLVGRPPGLT